MDEPAKMQLPHDDAWRDAYLRRETNYTDRILAETFKYGFMFERDQSFCSKAIGFLFDVSLEEVSLFVIIDRLSDAFED